MEGGWRAVALEADEEFDGFALFEEDDELRDGFLFFGPSGGVGAEVADGFGRGFDGAVAELEVFEVRLKRLHQVEADAAGGEVGLICIV